MLLDAKTLLTESKKTKRAIAALNTSSIECTQAIFEAASELKLPVIVSTSEGEAKHLLPELAVKMCETLSQIYNVEYVLHLDHGKDLDYIETCLKAGYRSVHVDYSELPLEENIEKTIKARNLTDPYNAQLEGEVGIIPYNYYEVTKEFEVTDPETAQLYVEKTKVDSLAVSIGTEHGKFKRVKELKIDALRKLNEVLPDMPFVLHGGSFLPDEQYLIAIQNGIAKINVNAEIRMAYSETLKKNLETSPDEYAPFRLLKGVKEAMKEIAKKKIELFNNKPRA